MVVVSCSAETNVDVSSKVINADGAPDKDLNKHLDVAKHDCAIPKEATNRDSKATDLMVPLSRKDNDTLTTAPNSDDFDNTTLAANGENTGIMAENRDQSKVDPPKLSRAR